MKKFYILICILLCCGCKARYEIKFFDDKIDDKLSVTYLKEDEVFRTFVPEPLYALDQVPYDLKSNESGDYVNLNYTHSFDVDDFSKARMPNRCFQNYNFIEEDGKYYFIIDGKFMCRHVGYNYFDSLDIVISTNHEVIQENADEKKNGKYIWHVNSKAETFSLRFITSKNVKSSSFKYYIIGLSTILIICTVFFGVRIIKNKNEI